MRVPAFLHPLIALPKGRFATWSARAIEQRTRVEVQGAVARLLVQRDARVLDVGFGAAESLSLLLGAAPQGRVSAIEPSTELVADAKQRFADAVTSGRLDARVGRAEELPYLGGAFDGVMTVHTLAFVTSPQAVVKELRRVLKPGGRLVIGMYTPADMTALGFTSPPWQLPDPSAVAGWCQDAGLKDAHVESAGRGLFVVGTLPDTQGTPG